MKGGKFVKLVCIFVLAICNGIVGKPVPIDNLNFNLLQNRPIYNADNHTYWKLDNGIEFQHGLASGDPTLSSVILWSRATPKLINYDELEPRFVYLEVSNSSMFDSEKRVFITSTDSSVDYTIKVEICDLLPGTHYYYRFFSSNGESTRVGITKTLPEPNSTEKVSFAVYSCSNYALGFFTSFAMPVVKQSVDYIIHLGDYIYEYANGKYTNGTSIGREHIPAHECWELDDYRKRHSQYKSDAYLQLSHASHPWIVVWDDHEVSDNSWLRGSVNSDGFQFYKRKQNALQAYAEWMPIKIDNLETYKIWRKFQFGRLIDLMMLDTRHYSRDITDIYTNADHIIGLRDREDRTMMGFDQEEWLYDSLKYSNSIWKLIGSQTVVKDVSFQSIGNTIGHPFTDKNYDSFDGYTANRRRLIETIAKNKVDNVIILSGDFHIAWINELYLTDDSYDMQTGEGSIAVELATSASCSPSTFPKEYSVDECYQVSKELLAGNTGILWNEGWFRGYFEITVDEYKIETNYFGVNVSNDRLKEEHLATFKMIKDTNRVERQPLTKPKYGYLDERILGK